MVLGETWIDHHGHHGQESTRGLIAPAGKDHPILRGIKDGDIWGPTDVYGVKLPLSGDGHAIFLGQIVAGMNPDDPAVTDAQGGDWYPDESIVFGVTEGDEAVHYCVMGPVEDTSGRANRWRTAP